MNSGKIFEQEIRESIPDNIFFLRIKDSASSFGSSSKTRFTLINPCDILLFNGIYLYLIELKTTQGSSLPFSNIQEHQINSLAKFDEFEKIIAGLIINFRMKEETYFIGISDFINFYNTTNKKSINIEDICKHGGLLIPHRKKRVRYIYDLKTLFEEVKNEG